MVVLASLPNDMPPAAYSTWANGLRLPSRFDTHSMSAHAQRSSAAAGERWMHELGVAFVQRDKHGHWAGACRATSNGYSKLTCGYVKGRASHQIGSISAMTEFLDDPADGKCRIRIQLR